MKIKWEDLKGKHVRIKNTIQLPLLNLPLNDEINALVLDVHPIDKKVKLRFEGEGEGVWFSILKDGYTQTELMFTRYRFIRELTKWEKLEFEVADYIGGFYDESGIDFNSDIKTKSKAECEYMQKSANFKIELFLPIKTIAASLFGFILASKIDLAVESGTPPISILFSPKVANLLLMLFFLSLSIAIYGWYLKYRKRYQELILRLEARILSDS